MPKFYSYAEWPEEAGPGYNLVTVDNHSTKEQAQAVCDLLQKHGLGGDGEIFPVRTWVEERD